MKDEDVVNVPSSLEAILATDYGISLPEGFRAVTLSEIASTTIGLSPSIYESNSTKTHTLKILLLSAKNILPSGEIDLEQASDIYLEDFNEVSSDRRLNSFLIQAKDILLPRIITRAKPRIALVPENPSTQVAFADSIIRIRVDTNLADPVKVFEFLVSDSGWDLLQQFASSLAGMTRVSPSGLTKTPIFLPRDPAEKNAKNLSTVSNVIQQIQEQILPALQKLELGAEANSGVSNLDRTDLQVVGQHLQDLAAKLVEPSLTDKVMTKYPTPIALAYRRFHDARFNVYEQMQRLVDLYEYTTFFVFNIVLADLFRRLDARHFYIENKRYRDAYKSYSVADRIGFIKEVIEIASSNRGADLFMPELVDSSFTVYADKLRDLRNNLAHTATASESMQRKILEEHKPLINELLYQLEFLTDCRLVRIPCFYCQGGQLIYRMIVYQGAAPLPEDKPIEGDSQLEKLQLAEHDHLVMINSEGQILDLYPVCQLVSNEETQYETHLCFLKYCKDGKIHVESIQTSVGLALDGLDELRELAKAKLFSQQPN